MGYEKLLLYKILLTNNIELFKQLDRKLFLNASKDYDKVFDYLTKYSNLPSVSIFENEYVFTENDLSLDINYVLLKVKENYSAFLKSKYQYTLEKCKTEKDKDTVLSDLALELCRFWNENSSEILSFDKYKDILQNKYTQITNRAYLGIMSGYKTLDKLSGGFLPKELYVVLGRLKQGKSQLLINIVNNILKQKKNVLFISMEMDSTQIFDRLIGINLKTNPNYYRLGKVSPFALDIINNIQIDNIKVVEGQFKATISEIITLATIENPDVLVIDGAYLIRVNKDISKTEKMEEIMTSLKTLAHNLNIPVLCSFQLGRETSRLGVIKAGKETADKIQWSDSIGQIMTSGLALYDTKDNNKIKLVEIVRGRHGEDGEFFINWDFDTGNFTEVEDSIIDNEEDF